MSTSLLELPVVQDAVDFALAKLQAWEEVPARVARARQAVQFLAQRDQGNPAALAQLTLEKQALDGIEQQYLGAAQLTGTILATARTIQAGGAVGPGALSDAARLAGTIASGLGALQQVEQALVEQGATLTPGEGGTVVPAWAKWGLIGLGAWWLYRRFA